MADHVFSSSEMGLALLALVMASAVLMGSPGPSTMSVMATAAAFGVRRSLGYVCGLILGTSCVLLAVATGAVALLLSLPGLAPVLSFASAAYISYLALRIATAPPVTERSRSAPAPSLAAGFLLAIANPKAYFAIAAMFTGSSVAEQAPATDSLLKVAVLAVMIVIIHAAWLLAGASLAGFLRDPLRSRLANIAFALMR